MLCGRGFAADIEDIMSRSPEGPAAIRDAGELIEEATRHLAAIERALEALQRRRRRWSTLAPAAQKVLREQIDYVEARREVAELELVELIELAELPIKFMGSA
jgi:pyridoxal biosynthesis lyase PdxS